MHRVHGVVDTGGWTAGWHHRRIKGGSVDWRGVQATRPMPPRPAGTIDPFRLAAMSARMHASRQLGVPGPHTRGGATRGVRTIPLIIRVVSGFERLGITMAS